MKLEILDSFLIEMYNLTKVNKEYKHLKREGVTFDKLLYFHFSLPLKKNASFNDYLFFFIHLVKTFLFLNKNSLSKTQVAQLNSFTFNFVEKIQKENREELDPPLNTLLTVLKTWIAL